MIKQSDKVKAFGLYEQKLRFQPPTERPDEVILGSGGQHGEVQVDHLGIERCVGDEVVLDVSLHREYFTHRQENQEAEEGGGHFTYHLHLRRNTFILLYLLLVEGLSDAPLDGFLCFWLHKTTKLADERSLW